MNNAVGQLLLTGVPGKVLDSETAKRFAELQPGGYILFGRNIESAPQLRKLIDDLRDLSNIEPIITIDQEGGRVSRLRLIGQEPPNARQLREKNDLELIRRHGDLTGRLLRLFGFNLDLCPVLDIAFDDEADNSLKGRCYGTNVAEIVAKAGTFNRAMREAGVLSCGKHFPGYAAAEVDPHHEVPVIQRTRAELEAEELAPFRLLLDDLDSLMACHSIFPAFDPDRPASLSPAILTKLLREEMGFKGLLMTDDLDMGAILNTTPFDETMIRAVEAGNDLLMICHRVELGEQAIAAVARDADRKAIDRALESLAAFKQHLSSPTSFDEETFAELNREVWDLRVAVLGEEKAKEKSVEDGKRSPVEMY